MTWYRRAKIGDLKRELLALRPAVARAAQGIYDQWEQDADGLDLDFGCGGICDAISEEMMDVVCQNLIDVEVEEGGQDGDCHSWIMIRRGDEIFGMDIRPGFYESGYGYNWTKIPGVTFTAAEVEIFPIGQV